MSRELFSFLDLDAPTGEHRMSEFDRHFHVREYDDIVVLQLVDPRLLSNLLCDELQSELLDYLKTEQPRRVVVDFGAVTHSFTAVINGLLLARKRLAATRGELKLCDMTDAVREAYRMLNLDGTIFEIYDTVEEAIDSWHETLTTTKTVA